MAVLYAQHFVQFFDDNGDPLNGGKLYTYDAGTTTPKATYTDAAGATPNANPVILDSAGRATVFLSGSYKFRLEDSLGTLIKETDNVTAFSSGDSGVDSITTTFTEDVISTSDSIIFSDYSDGNRTKRDTVQGILDLVKSRVNGFRLTLTTGVPVTTSDVTAATTIYCTPYKGNSIALYDGTTWVIRSSSGFSLALGTLTASLPYDVFCYDNNGTPTLEFTAWTNTTTRATALAYQDGVLVKSGAATRRYLGTFYTTSTTTTEDSAASRLLWNYYNRVDRQLNVSDATNSWAYTTATYRQARAQASNKLQIVVGVAECAIDVSCIAFANNTGSVQLATGIGVDSTSSNSAIIKGGQVSGSSDIPGVFSHYRGVPSAGYHYYAWLEYSVATGTTTWYGTINEIKSGINAIWKC